MSFGPSAPKPDYKNMWKNYSGWISEASSVFSRQSSTSKVKMAAFGITGVTPKAVQLGGESSFNEELNKLRQGHTGDTLKKYAEGKTGWNVDILRNIGKEGYDPANELAKYGWTPDQFQEMSVEYKKALGVTPEPWELYFFNRYGFSETKFTDKELSVFKSQEAGGKSSKGLLASLSAVDETSKSPWV